MKKTEISRTKYIQTCGLLAIAKVQYRALRETEKALCELYGEEFNSGGHCGDAIYSEYDADTLLKQLQLTVAKK